jgi:hypothetical protein
MFSKGVSCLSAALLLAHTGVAAPIAFHLSRDAALTSDADVKLGDESCSDIGSFADAYVSLTLVGLRLRQAS